MKYLSNKFQNTSLLHKTYRGNITLSMKYYTCFADCLPNICRFHFTEILSSLKFEVEYFNNQNIR